MLEAEEISRIRHERFDYADSIQGYEPFQLRDSSRVKYNLFADEWTAEDNSSTSVPFGVHQIYEEIVAPMVQRLLPLRAEDAHKGDAGRVVVCAGSGKSASCGPTKV